MLLKSFILTGFLATATIVSAIPTPFKAGDAVTTIRTGTLDTLGAPAIGSVATKRHHTSGDKTEVEDKTGKTEKPGKANKTETVVPGTNRTKVALPGTNSTNVHNCTDSGNSTTIRYNLKWRRHHTSGDSDSGDGTRRGGGDGNKPKKAKPNGIKANSTAPACNEDNDNNGTPQNQRREVESDSGSELMKRHHTSGDAGTPKPEDPKPDPNKASPGKCQCRNKNAKRHHTSGDSGTENPKPDNQDQNQNQNPKPTSTSTPTPTPSPKPSSSPKPRPVSDATTVEVEC